MRVYLDYLQDILEHGVRKDDRTGTGTISTFGRQLRFDLQAGFPLLTTKKVWVRGVIAELLWFLDGGTNIRPLVQQGVSIWTDWPLKRYREATGEAIEQDAFEQRVAADPDFAAEWGELGPVYGRQWRDFAGPNGTRVDQIAQLIDSLRTKPHSRRHLVSAWHPAQIGDMALPPCFTADALVATSEGYHPIADIKKGDTVMTGTGQLQTINKVWETSYRGELLKIRPWYTARAIECTPNHPFLVRDKGWLDASELTEEDYVAVPRLQNEEIPVFTYERPHNLWDTSTTIEHEATADDFYTFGYFLGDGWASQNGRPRIHFSIANVEAKEVLPRIRKTIKVSEKPGGGENVTTYQTTSHQWINVFKDFGHKAANKRIPVWVLNAPQAYLERFIEGYCAADGVEHSTGALQFTTVSRDLAYGLQLIMAKLGRVGSIYHQKRPETTTIEGRTVNQSDTYTIHVRTRNNYTVVEEDVLWIKIRSIEREQADTTVYNLDVGDEHTYTADNVINHNCHYAFQCWVEPVADGPDRLSLMWQQRSVDSFLGLPFNIASYAFLTHMLAQQTGYDVGTLIFSGGDCHIYQNHIEQVETQLARAPYPLPTLTLRRCPDSLFDYRADDFTIEGYRHHPAIRAPIAV
jgi:thymidylate synthase